MRCSNCGSENLAGKKFCGDCGKALDDRCPKCGADNPAGKNFCGDCGASLDPAAPAVAQPRDPGLTGERRHLTVLFCDLVGSTHIAAQLDPEEWREMVAGYQRAAAEAISRAGGNVAKYLGDGVMAYFGYPEAHENDAERAVRAGLSILDAIAKFNQQSPRQTLSARIGIDSGAVVVGAGAGKEADVFGEAPNNAARLQALAAPGTVLISAATHRLVSGLFVVEDRGAQTLKGIERPVQLYRIIQPSGARGRLEASAASCGLTPFVGREEEVRLLKNRWERAVDGEGQVVLIVGEAGIGKSRLIQRFREEISGTPHSWFEAAAEPSFQNTPFYPVANLLQQFLGSDGNMSPEAQLARLQHRLELVGLKPAEDMPLIAPLLNLPLSVKYPPSPLPPQQQRRRRLAMLVECVLGAAREKPLIVATEDLHWADPSTLELIRLLVEQGATARLLLLYTARSEFHTQWPLRAHHAHIMLNQLSARNVRSMVEQLAAHKPLSDETLATVVERAGGVPLFVEELTRSLLESGGGGPPLQEIPVTLHDLLMARLDRLGSAKEIAQVGAVIGSEFSYELLHAIHPMAEEDLQLALGTLADAELVHVRGLPPNVTYQFKHALIRDAAYEALLKSRRKELHRLVATTIDERFPALKEARAEVLARHWGEAGEAEAGIAAWINAGRAAESRNAFKEALESYQRAVALLNTLPEAPQSGHREFHLRQLIVRLLQITKGWAAPETIEATDRAAALAEKSGNPSQLANSLGTRSLSAWVAGEFSNALVLADRALELRIHQGNPTRIANAYMLEVMSRYCLGDFAGAQQYFTDGQAFFDDPLFRQDPTGAVVSAYAYGNLTAWMLGHADRARDQLAKLVAAANNRNPHIVTLARVHELTFWTLMREYSRVEGLAMETIEFADKHQFVEAAARSRCMLGEARAQLGDARNGVALIREYMPRLLPVGRVVISKYAIGLAVAQACAGAIADGLETIEQVLTIKPEEPAYRPEALRVSGELHLRERRTELAEEDFREALDLAQKMHAKAWELRSTISLARLLRDTGRHDEASAMLAEIYNWFTEGFDTVDLKEAKALLEGLGGTAARAS
jgi:class 3 adenylate cyclase/tetratricopeptide (TPR) repeat protein